MPPLNFKLLTPPAAEPVSLALAKSHCRVTIDDDDALIQGYISAARQLCEHEMHRSIYEQGFQRTLDRFPLYPWWTGTAMSTALHDAWYWSNIWKGYVIRLPRPALVSVESITYLDVSGNPQTLPANTYQVVTDKEPGEVVPNWTLWWPYTQQWLPGSVKVKYTAGTWGDGVEVADCPELVQVAILITTGNFYENREVSGLPDGVRTLLQPYTFECWDWDNN
jgi:hypothetical protein